MNNKNPDIIKDTPLGLLLIVVSLYVLYFAWSVTNYIAPINFAILLCALFVFNVVWKVGILLIRGTDIQND